AADPVVDGRAAVGRRDRELRAEGSAVEQARSTAAPIGAGEEEHGVPLVVGRNRPPVRPRRWVARPHLATTLVFDRDLAGRLVDQEAQEAALGGGGEAVRRRRGDRGGAEEQPEQDRRTRGGPTAWRSRRPPPSRRGPAAPSRGRGGRRTR